MKFKKISTGFSYENVMVTDNDIITAIFYLMSA